MLIARPTKRDSATRFKVDVRLDLQRDGETIGGFVYAMRAESAELTLRGESYGMARARPRRDDTPLARTIRAVTGQGKPGPNPLRLTDGGRRVLATAEERPGGTAIEMDRNRFELRRRSVFSRRFNLGSVGQQSLLSTTVTSDFPPEVSELQQAFLIMLLIDMTITALDTSGS